MKKKKPTKTVKIVIDHGQSNEVTAGNLKIELFVVRYKVPSFQCVIKR